MSININKQEYIQSINVKPFIEWIKNSIASKNQFDYKPKKVWSKGSLSAIALDYSWPGIGNGTFEENNNYIKLLSNELKTAFEAGDEKKAFCSCIKVLEWGGVQNGAHGIAVLFCEGRLIETIKAGLSELLKEDVFISSFDNKFRMNASFTKIYSLISNDPFIIYDSRVAAGLGVLAKEYWLAQHPTNRNGSFPNELMFVRLEDRSTVNRDASDVSNDITFPKIRAHHKERWHAQWNVYANWIVGEVITDINNFANQKSLLDKSRALEAALFMIGKETK